MNIVSKFNSILFIVLLSPTIVLSQEPLHVISVQFNPKPNEHKITFLCSDNSSKLWNTTNKTITNMPADNIHSQINNTNKSYQNTFTDKSIQLTQFPKMIIGYKNKKILTNVTFSKPIVSCALNAHNEENPIIAIGHENKTLLYTQLEKYDPNKPFAALLSKPIHTFDHQGLNSTALAFNNDGTEFISCTDDGTITWCSIKNEIEHKNTINIDPAFAKRSLIFKSLYRNATALAAFCLIWLCYTKYIAQSLTI